MGSWLFWWPFPDHKTIEAAYFDFTFDNGFPDNFQGDLDKSKCLVFDAEVFIQVVGLIQSLNPHIKISSQDWPHHHRFKLNLS
jgi:hypothetical protein